MADRFAAAAQRSLGANDSRREHVITVSRRTARHITNNRQPTIEEDKFLGTGP